jgi:hypothetical protein
MSDTPETDAEHAQFPMGGFTLDFARKLERERDKALFDLNDVRAERDEARETAERYRLEANAMMMQRDRLIEVLQNIRTGWGGREF